MNLPAPAAPADVLDPEAIGHLPQALVDALAAAREFAAADKSDATRLAYTADFDDFAEWCLRMGICHLPAQPGAVAAYLASLADRKLKVGTIARRLAAIAHVHRLAGHESPTTAVTVRSVLKGIKRKLGSRPVKKAPVTDAVLVKVLRKIPSDTLLGLRDRALLLLAFSGALRRSEIVGLDLEHIERRPEGILLLITRSKADQEGRGQTIAIPHGTKLKPVAALDLWLRAAAITDGAVFRGVNRHGQVQDGRLCDRQVARVVKRYVGAIGLDASLFSGHSMRSGFATTAGRADLVGTAAHLRHAKLDTTRGYIQAEDAFANNPGRKFL